MSAGSGPTTLMPADLQSRDRRCDHRVVFVSHQPMLACMRVETRHGDAWPVTAEPRQLAGGQRDRAGDQVARERARHLGERNVDGGEHDPQFGRVEHHRDEAAAGHVGEQVSVPSPREARQGECLLADGRRRDTIHPPGHRIVHRAHDQVVRCTPRSPREHAGRERLRRRRRVDDRLADLEDLRVSGRLCGHLRPDPRRIPDRQRDSGPHGSPATGSGAVSAGSGPGTVE